MAECKKTLAKILRITILKSFTISQKRSPMKSVKFVRNYQIISVSNVFLFLSSITLTFTPLRAQDLLIEKNYDCQAPINIGFPDGKGSVCLSSECLDPQIVWGTATTIHAGSAVEPSIGVNPKDSRHVVACWQQDRINNGGGLEAGIAYSKDGGKNWHRTVIPVQICQGGVNQRCSDLWISYSNDGKLVYLMGLIFNANYDPSSPTQFGVMSWVSKNDGETWGKGVLLFSSDGYLNEPTGLPPVPDSTSITADRNHSKLAYGVYDVFPSAHSFHSNTVFNKTTNDGKTWSSPKIIYNPFGDVPSNNIENDCQTISNHIVVQPKCITKSQSPKLNGDLLNFMVRIYATPNATNVDYITDTWPYQYHLYDIAFSRSKDLGESWDKNATVVKNITNARVYTGGYFYDSQGNIAGGIGYFMRTGSFLPSYNVNPKNGNLYVAYQTGEFTPNQLPQIGLTASHDGGYTWTQSVRVSQTPLYAPNPQAFTPSVAITGTGYVGILYSDFREDDMSDPTKTKTNTWLAIYKEVNDSQGGSTGIGLDFIKEIRLTNRSYIAQNGPSTTQGIMTNGDYPFLDADKTTFYACFTKSERGPFTPPRTIASDTLSGTLLLLDHNYRSAPYFKVVNPSD